MDITEIIVVAIACLCLFVIMPTVISISSYKEKKLKLERELVQSGGEDLRALVADMHGEITTLRDRVRVLERLATDGDRDLADRIERLRRSETMPGA